VYFIIRYQLYEQYFITNEKQYDNDLNIVISLLMFDSLIDMQI